MKGPRSPLKVSRAKGRTKRKATPAKGKPRGTRNGLGLTLDKRKVRSYILGVAKKLNSPTRPKAIGLVRVSSAKQADEGGSLDAQREAIARHAVLSGYDLVDIFEDAGISGSKDETKRPGLSAALAAIEDGFASVLVVTHLDRLARSSDLAGFLRTQINRAGGKLDCIAEVKDDPIRNAVDKMLAELERIRGSQRMKTFHAGRKAKGLPAGPAPYGFAIGEDGKLEAVAAEAPTVERILARRAAGASLRTIAAELNSDAVPTRSGKPWNPQTVNAIAERSKDTPTD